VRMSREASDYLKTHTGSTSKSKKMDSLMQTVSFKRTTYDVMDNKSAVGIMVERTRSNGKLVVRYSTRDGTAHAGENYIGGPGQLIFKHGEKVASISIQLVDTDFEEGESAKTFYVRLHEGAVVRGKVFSVFPFLKAFKNYGFYVSFSSKIYKTILFPHTPHFQMRRLYSLRSTFEAEVRIWDNGEPVVGDHDVPNNLEEIAK
jgi:hypothetical protein